MSSIGPATFVICSSDANTDSIVIESQRFGMSLKFKTQINTSGMHVEDVKMPQLIHVVGKPFAGKSFVCS